MKRPPISPPRRNAAHVSNVASSWSPREIAAGLELDDRAARGDFLESKAIRGDWIGNDAALHCLAVERTWALSSASVTSSRSVFLLAERLVEIWSSNEHDLAQLRSLEIKAAQARAYLLSPGCNRLLGQTYLDRLLKKRKILLTRLHASRRSAWQLLSLLDPQFPPSARSRAARDLWAS